MTPNRPVATTSPPPHLSPAPPLAATPDTLFRAYGLAIGATVFWSSNVVAVKFILQDLPALPAAALRICITAVILLLIRLVAPRTLFFRWRDLRHHIYLGVVGIAGGFGFVTSALSYTSVSHVVFIVALVPLTVMLYGSARGHDRLTALKILGTILSVTGVALLAMNQPEGNQAGLHGDLLAFGGMFCFSFFALRGKSFAGVYDSLTLVSNSFLLACSVALPVLLVSAPGIAWESVSQAGWIALAYSGVLGSAVAYLCFYASLRVLTASQVTAFHYVQPVLATMIGFLLLGEQLDAQFALAAALILGGVFLAERKH
jgi:drug/metabolite transporter (DMT)-like permease